MLLFSHPLRRNHITSRRLSSNLRLKLTVKLCYTFLTHYGEITLPLGDYSVLPRYQSTLMNEGNSTLALVTTFLVNYMLLTAIISKPLITVQCKQRKFSPRNRLPYLINLLILNCFPIIIVKIFEVIADEFDQKNNNNIQKKKKTKISTKKHKFNKFQ